MTLKNLLIKHNELVNNETFIYVRNEENTSLLTSGNWYQDNVLHYFQKEISRFTWKNDNKLYINLEKGE